MATLDDDDARALISLLEKGCVKSQNGVAGETWSTRAECTLVNGSSAVCTFTPGGSLTGADAQQVIDLLTKASVKSTRGIVGPSWTCQINCTLVNGLSAIGTIFG